MWEGGWTLNRITQAPPLRSARIQRLSSRSWHPFQYTQTFQSVSPIWPKLQPPTPQKNTIATVSCETCQHAMGGMCTEKWLKAPLPESMWRQRYFNTFNDDFRVWRNEPIKRKINTWYCMTKQGNSKVAKWIRAFPFGSISVGMVKTNMYIMTWKYKIIVLGRNQLAYSSLFFWGVYVSVCLILII